MGARRAKETARLEEEVQALREEVQHLRNRERKWIARERKTKSMQAKVAERFKQLLAQNVRSAAASAGDIAEAGQEVLRSHQMTLSILHQYRDYCIERETEHVVLQRRYDLASEQLEYYIARNAQMEVLAKTVLVHAKEQGLLQEGSKLSHLVKAVRESHPVPTRSEQQWEERAQAVTVVAEDQLPAKCASLQERVREFEHFLELRKSQLQQKTEIQRQTARSPRTEDSPTSPTSSPVVSVAARPAGPLSDRELSLASGSKAAQTLGLETSEGRVPPVLPARRAAPAKESVVVTKRSTPAQFPFVEWPTVLHVQQVVTVLGAARPRVAVPTQQIDAVREEANKTRPNVEWLIQELSPQLASNSSAGFPATLGKLSRGIGARVRSQSGLEPAYKLDAEWRTDSGLSLLHVLVVHDDAAKLLDEMVKRHGFTGDETDSQGVSSFMYACMYSAPCAQRLLKANPRLINQVCREDLTPLHVAALYGNTACCKMLLDSNADMECDRHGASPLMYALLNDKPETVSFFASKVAGSVTLGDTLGNTPLLVASCVSTNEVIGDLLRGGARPGVANSLGLSPLWMALQKDNAQLLQLLLGAPGVDLDQPYGPYKWTLLMMCVAFLPDSKAAGAVKLLLSRGASHQAVNAEKKTALFHAVMLDKVEAVRMLLDAGADSNAKDVFDNRPLHFTQSVQAVTLLVASGGKINVKNRAGNTPLHYACLFQNVEVAKILVASGSSEAVVNEVGESPSDMAKYNAQLAMPFFLSDLCSSNTGGIVLSTK